MTKILKKISRLNRVDDIDAELAKMSMSQRS